LHVTSFGLLQGTLISWSLKDRLEIIPSYIWLEGT
jgi:hypothetical protein